MTSLAAALAGDARARLLAVHVDDVGMCHGANTAFLELARAGQVSCGSAMVPCPWFREIADAAAQDRTLDLGVHLTLTSEWPHYRWGPVSTVSRASGLVDEQGCFPRTCQALRAGLVVEAAEAELRAQVDRALAAGIDVTHLDTHMGAAAMPELVDVYLRLARDYRLPLLLPRELDSYTGVLRLGELPPGSYEPAFAALDAGALPLFDRFRMTPGFASDEVETGYRHLIDSLPAGATFLAVHCNAPGDIESIVPPRAHWRTDEYRLFGSGRPREWMAAAGIRAVGMRAVRELWRAALPD